MTKENVNIQTDDTPKENEDIPKENEDTLKEMKEEKCYVLMPSGKKDEYYGKEAESQYIYQKIIVPAVEKFAKKTNRNIKPDMAVESRYTGSISKKIIEDIAKAEICIVDITGYNPNVFFELGVRYSLRNKTTILLRQDKRDPTKDKIPFDIQGYRCITYNCFLPEQASKELYDFLCSSQNKDLKTDSLVFETFKNMEVMIPDILSCFGEDCDSLSWADYWAHINQQAEKLRKEKEKHDIHVILGISNGGLMAADLIGRLIFKDVPILALWADRRSRANFDENVDRSCYFFDNGYNQAVMKSIKEVCFEKVNDHKIGILLVDDLIYTSNTCLQAKAFLMKELKGYEEKYQIIFLPLYCRRSSDIPIDQIEDILICKYTNEDIDNYLKNLQSTKRKFPYNKDLY